MDSHGGSSSSAAPGAQDIAFVRITLLGQSGCGKSSLVNAFVNNVFYKAYQPTLEPQLYYTTMRLSNLDMGSDYAALLEIEDTHGSDYGVTKTGDAEIKYFYDPWAPSTWEQKRELQDKKDITDNGLVRSTRLPFSMCRAPIAVDQQAKQVYEPLTRNRMAYLIIFDVLDKASFQEACRLAQELAHKLDSCSLRPLIFLVANKIDEDPWCPEFELHKRSAQKFAKDSHLPYFEVSAMHFRGVKKLFRNVLLAVKDESKLWMSPHFPSVLADDSSDQWLSTNFPAVSAAADEMAGKCAHQ